MTLLLTLITAYIIFTTIYLLFIFNSRKRNGERDIERAREAAYFETSKLPHKSRKVPSIRY